MSNDVLTAAGATHPTCNCPDGVGCDLCDPPGQPRGVFGDVDGDWAEAEGEVVAAQFDNDPNPYEGTYFE